MPNGNIHALASVALAGPAGVATFAFTGSLGDAAMAAGGCVLGYLISPDLDQDGRTISESLVYEVSGIAGYLWQVYWYPYALAVKHREWKSHAPVVGTLGRLTYLWLPWVGLAAATGRVPDLLWLLGTLWPVWAGLAASDVAHWLLDQIG